MAARFALPVGDRAGLQLKTLLDSNGQELVGGDHRDHHHPMRMVMVVAGLPPCRVPLCRCLVSTAALLLVVYYSMVEVDTYVRTK